MVSEHRIPTYLTAHVYQTTFKTELHSHVLRVLHHMPETENAAMFTCTLSLMFIKSQFHANVLLHTSMNCIGLWMTLLTWRHALISS